MTENGRSHGPVYNSKLSSNISILGKKECVTLNQNEIVIKIRSSFETESMISHPNLTWFKEIPSHLKRRKNKSRKSFLYTRREKSFHENVWTIAKHSGRVTRIIKTDKYIHIFYGPVTLLNRIIVHLKSAVFVRIILKKRAPVRNRISFHLFMRCSFFKCFCLVEFVISIHEMINETKQFNSI